MRNLLVIVFFIHSNIYSQGENNTWLFDLNRGIQFQSVVPVKLSSSQNFELANEAICTVSDSEGALLFYSNGVNVWDRSHNLMQNGSDIGGHFSTTQGVVAVRSPSNFDEFYVFALESNGGNGSLYYSIVNMNSNGGMGTVTQDKRIFLATNLTEKMIAVNGNCNSSWVVTHERETNAFLSFEINSAGVFNNPVVSTIGTIQGKSDAGQMKVSRDNSKIAIEAQKGIVDLLKFNNSTGKLSEAIKIELTVFDSFPSVGYAVCFSPDGELLYVGENSNISSTDFSVTTRLHQFKISTLNSDSIMTSKFLIAENLNPISFGLPFDLQLGPDNQIYVSGVARTFLGAIQNPNGIGAKANYNDTAVFVGPGSIQTIGLQNLVVVPDSIPELEQPFVRDTTLCSSTALFLQANTPQVDYLWQDGSRDSIFMVSESGIYWVERTIGECAMRRDSITVTMIDAALNLGQDTVLCVGESLELSIENDLDQITWENGTTDRTRTIIQPGIYIAEALAISSNCLVRDTINIEFETLENIDLGVDTTLCEGETFLLGENLEAEGLSLLWSDGQMAPTFQVTQSGDYWAEASRGDCYAIDTIAVTFQEAFDISLAEDRSKCPEDLLELTVNDPSYTYLWSDGSTASSIFVSELGTYWVKAFDGICEATDTISVTTSEKCLEEKHFIPNIFSPNGDGTNDEFKVNLDGELADYKLAIYDRWGTIHYTSSDPLSTWSGKSDNRDLSSGVYIYHITYTLSGENRVRTLSGSTTLVR